MTNLAPLWGVPVERAHVTASANYLEVVLLHSVVVFVPMFAVWAWLLGRYRFHPATVFLLFGITGLLAETLSFGLANPLLAGFWIYVYGLMVYLPACAFPPGPNRRRPRSAVVIGGILLPLLAAVPVAVLLMLLDNRTQPADSRRQPPGGGVRTQHVCCSMRITSSVIYELGDHSDAGEWSKRFVQGVTPTS